MTTTPPDSHNGSTGCFPDHFPDSGKKVKSSAGCFPSDGRKEDKKTQEKELHKDIARLERGKIVYEPHRRIVLATYIRKLEADLSKYRTQAEVAREQSTGFYEENMKLKASQSCCHCGSKEAGYFTCAKCEDAHDTEFRALRAKVFELAHPRAADGTTIKQQATVIKALEAREKKLAAALRECAKSPGSIRRIVSQILHPK